jgi:hypothetical protein
MKLSVIIANYNYRDFVRAAIGSTTAADSLWREDCCARVGTPMTTRTRLAIAQVRTTFKATLGGRFV